MVSTIASTLAVVQSLSGVMRHRTAVSNWLQASFRVAQLLGHHTADVGEALPRTIPTGEVVSTVTNDAMRLGGAFDITARLSGAVASYAVVAVVLLRTSVPLGLLVLVGVPVLTGALGLLVRPLQRRQAAQREEAGRLTTLGADTVAGGAGEDQLLGGSQNDSLDGGADGDTVNGGVGDDTLLGGDGSDRLVGSAGDDVLLGGLGGDMLVGGAGADVFRFLAPAESARGGPGRDTIRDFQPGDRIDLSAIDANGALPGDPLFDFIGTAAFTAPGQIRVLESGANTIVQVNIAGSGLADMAIRLMGVHSLTEIDFIR